MYANGEWRRLHNEELHSLYTSHNIVKVIKSRRLRWAVGLDGLEVTCPPRDPRFADSIPAEVDGFFQDV